MLVITFRRITDNQLLQLVCYLIREHFALFVKLFFSYAHHFFHEDRVSLSCALEVNLGL